MILQMSQVKTSLDEGYNAAADKALSVLKIKPENVASVKLSKVSIDARRRDRICFVSNIAIEVDDIYGKKLLKIHNTHLFLLDYTAAPWYNQIEISPQKL